MNILTFSRLLTVAVVLLLLTGTSDKNSRAFASPGFDIPISELKKVEKKKQRKSEGRRNRESKKSKKSEAEKNVSPTTTTSPTATPTATTVPTTTAPAITTPQTTLPTPVTTEKAVGTAPSATVETVSPAVPVVPAAAPPQPSVAQPETKPAPAASEPEKTASTPSVTIEPATAKPAGPADRPLPAEEEEYRISHEPFSYLVAGKMTKLMAVVISKNDVLTMRCRFRAGEKGQYGEIEMLLAPGSKFTYSAVIPALIPGATALYYEFVLTDNQGKKFRSQEYRIPLNATAVVPGWQYGLSRARINVVLENPAQPFEGFVGLTAGEN